MRVTSLTSAHTSAGVASMWTVTEPFTHVRLREHYGHTRMAREKRPPLVESNAYNLFILVLTVLSLIVMLVMMVPFFDPTIQLLSFYDNAICVIFLFDFTLRMKHAKPTSQYFIHERGWL